MPFGFRNARPITPDGSITKSRGDGSLFPIRLPPLPPLLALLLLPPSSSPPPYNRVLFLSVFFSFHSLTNWKKILFNNIRTVFYLFVIYIYVRLRRNYVLSLQIPLCVRNNRTLLKLFQWSLNSQYVVIEKRTINLNMSHEYYTIVYSWY